MKIIAIFSILFAVIGLSQSQLGPCVLEAIPVGLCNIRFSGYTYSPIRNRCTNFVAKGCTITGNYFETRKDCDDKCKQFNSFREAPFTYFFDRALERVNDALSYFTS